MIFLTSANYPAAVAGTRTSPIDEGNLNRSFPGDPDGGVTAQIAWYIENVLLPQCDYVFDLHSGGSSLMYIPSGLCRRQQDPARMARSLALLEAFAAPVSYVTDAPQGEDRTLTAAAARQGVIHLGTELGGGGTLTIAALRTAAARRAPRAETGRCPRRSGRPRAGHSPAAGPRFGLLCLRARRGPVRAEGRPG